MVKKKRADQLQPGDLIQLLNDNTDYVIHVETESKYHRNGCTVRMQSTPPIYCNNNMEFEIVDVLYEFARTLLQR